MTAISNTNVHDKTELRRGEGGEGGASEANTPAPNQKKHPTDAQHLKFKFRCENNLCLKKITYLSKVKS